MQDLAVPQNRILFSLNLSFMLSFDLCSIQQAQYLPVTASVLQIIVKSLHDKRKYCKRRAKISADVSAHFFRVMCNEVAGEIRKCGFWCKLPLFDHFCGAPTQMMKISNFHIYSFTNDLLPSGLYDLVFMKRPNWRSPIGYFIIPTIYYNIYNLLYGPNFSWSLILVIRSSPSAH